MKYDILDRDVKERWYPEVERLRAKVNEAQAIARDWATENERLRALLDDVKRALVVDGIAARSNPDDPRVKRAGALLLSIKDALRGEEDVTPP
jgi:hypothetical protein